MFCVYLAGKGAGVSDYHATMLTGDLELDASVVYIATADVENRKRGRSCPAAACPFSRNEKCTGPYIHGIRTHDVVGT